ncbi:MAG: ABC transporter ATP-binding protein [Clostridia bacterium]|nr:ABC transporter ATP-binding protein [Clostridia bacterium]
MKEKMSSNRLARKEQKRKLKDEKHFEKYGIYPSEIVDKDNKKGKIKYLFKFKHYFKGEGLKLIFVLLIWALLIAVNVAMPLVLSYAIDTLMLQEWQHALLQLGILVGMMCFADLSYYSLNILLAKILNRVTTKMRSDLANNIINVKVSKFDSVGSGEILNRVSVDPEVFNDSISILLEKVKGVVIGFGRLSIFFTFSIWIGLYMTLAGVAIYLLSVFISKKFHIPAQKRGAKVSDNYQSVSNELIKGIRDVKSLNLNNNFLARFKKLLGNINNSNNNQAVASNAYEGIPGIVLDVLAFGAYALSIFLITQDIMTVGNLLSIFSFEWTAYHAFTYLADIKDILFKMDFRAKRMYEIMDNKEYPKEIFGDRVLDNVKGKIEFKNVNFNYGETTIFENLNLTIKAGECVGLVGKSGEGKSTILNLLPRLYDVSSGDILIDDVDTRRLTCDSLRNSVSIVPQSPYIFNVSIRENLLYVNPNATQEEIEEACRKAQIHDFIISRPEGYETKVGEGGVVLSGGQKQRLAIARAFLRGSKILLLDDATSALDNESQEKVKQAINNLKGDCTILIVAHRLSTVQDCDKIMVLENHKIVAEGSHSKLLKSCPVYRDLYKSDVEAI